MSFMGSLNSFLSSVKSRNFCSTKIYRFCDALAPPNRFIVSFPLYPLDSINRSLLMEFYDPPGPPNRANLRTILGPISSYSACNTLVRIHFITEMLGYIA